MEGSELFLDKYKHWVVDYLGKKTPLNEYEIERKKRKQSNKQKIRVAKTNPTQRESEKKQN